jgi:hypothetical protein
MKRTSWLDSPLRWASLYLLAIPLFAWIFDCILPAGSFFHSTLQHEPEIRKRSEILAQDIWKGYSSPGPKDDEECQSIAPVARSVNPDSLKIDGDDVSFSASYYLGVWPSTYSVQPSIHFSLARNFDLPQRLPPGKGRGMIFKEVRVEGIQPSPWAGSKGYPALTRCLFPTLYDKDLPANVALLEIPTALDERIHEIADELRGVPRNKKGGFWRMLYLSASTITTTGFGDIVPLTTPARICVTTESIIGVTLIGLFLNAISRRKDKG